MKRIKRLASLVLAMAMVFAMSMTTFAALGDPTPEENVEAGNPAEPEVQAASTTGDSTYKLTIKTVKNHTYSIYQLATGDVAKDGVTLSNIKVGSNAKSDTTVAKIQELNNQSGADLGDAAYALINTSSDPVETVTGNGEAQVVILSGGYYVVTDTFVQPGQTTPGETIDSTVSRTMVALVGDAEMTPKTISVEPDKKIKDNEKLETTNEASIGDVITYQLSGSIPDMSGYKTFKYVLVDQASKGLKHSIKDKDTGERRPIRVGDELTGGIGTRNSETGAITPVSGVTVTYKVTKVDEETNTIRLGVTGKVNNVEKYALAYSNYGPQGDTIFWFYVDIEATLTANAVVTTDSNKNNVKIEYSNNPNYVYTGDPDTPDFKDGDPIGTTVEKTVETYTTSLTITKKDGDTKTSLTGAEFTLVGVDQVNVGYVTGKEYVEDNAGTWYKLKDGSYTETVPGSVVNGVTISADKYESTTKKYKVVNVAEPDLVPAGQTTVKAFVDANGEVKFTGLGAGTYILKESVTPDGYNTMDPIAFKVEWTLADGFKVTKIMKVENDSPVENSTVDESTFKITVAKGTVREKEVGTVLSSEVLNFSGTTLPSTGGIGTTIFYVVGGIMVAGAGILLVTKKRMKARQA